MQRSQGVGLSVCYSCMWLGSLYSGPQEGWMVSSVAQNWEIRASATWRRDESKQD